ncbi:hypothetical protein [Streptomyces sp. IBSBF 2435]|uniref:hypothetical protein n=1 Tax=Streptomyces sp. IBSBF 2435 TaxID=2903531 RepID=UPI002FDBD211
MTTTPGRLDQAPGVVLTSGAEGRTLDHLREGIAARFLAESEEHYLAPPVLSRAVCERAGYPGTFPHLLGSVHGSPDGGAPAPTDLVLTSAACHHLYPLLAGRTVTATGQLSVEAVCYRAEATAETGRLRSFRMYEIVRFGAPDAVADWRDSALASVAEWLRGLGLGITVELASDPFFGRPGLLMSDVQRSKQLKWEVLAEVDEGLAQAVASANYHEDHFGRAFGFTLPDGSPAHSACVAFGLDRLLLALRHRHGPGAGWDAGPQVRGTEDF